MENKVGIVRQDQGVQSFILRLTVPSEGVFSTLIKITLLVETLNQNVVKSNKINFN